MSTLTAGKAANYALQAVCYAAFMAVVGYFATSPPYVHLPAGQAVVKLSLQHAGQRKEACRERSAEELAKLAPNMRAASDCPRERAPLVVDIRMDDQPLFALVAPPRGLSRDGASTVYRRVAVAAGTHRFETRLADSVDGTFRFTGQRTVDLKPGRVLVIDFDAKEGGWVFRE
ncbi:MAG: hypothetical protein IPG28_09290 [Betaproteobacteria bacterium]|nr:hypothetical protein [Betaproteobacteria bacterium]MBK6601730.1 hypothetical protein [Betaproteobacteria bacterium]MBK7082495.1 hypothetical protein [Betaproteobacteria bacterium]MBK7591329.1 hypothetical protein [Betaproteobacteria bacterium]MBK7744238.1 hypothetical protein [Betaproteobacteria bacterium]